MIREHCEVKDMFMNYFCKNGYSQTPTLDLITSDRSIKFTNSTIVGWKNNLLAGNVDKNGHVMYQPCLRLRGLNDKLTEESLMEKESNRFLGYFKMLGILGDKNREEAMQEDILGLLLNEYGMPKDRLRVYFSYEMDFLDIIGQELDMRISKDRTVKWNYGVDGLVGEGANFEILQKNGVPRQIGQLVKISHEKDTIGYEFGFGIETFLARKNDDKSYNSWAISQVVPEDLRFKSFLDVYSCLGATYSIPSESITKRSRHEINKIRRTSLDMEEFVGVSPDKTNKIIADFVQLEFGKDVVARVELELGKARETREGNRRRLISFLEKNINKGVDREKIIKDAEMFNNNGLGISKEFRGELYKRF